MFFRSAFTHGPLSLHGPLVTSAIMNSGLVLLLSKGLSSFISNSLRYGKRTPYKSASVFWDCGSRGPGWTTKFSILRNPFRRKYQYAIFAAGRNLLSIRDTSFGESKTRAMGSPPLTGPE